MNQAKWPRRTPKWPVRVLTIVAAVGLAVAMTGIQPVAAAAPPPNFGVYPNPAHPGAQITFNSTAFACAPGETAIVSLSGAGVPTTTASGTANVTAVSLSLWSSRPPTRLAATPRTDNAVKPARSQRPPSP